MKVVYKEKNTRPCKKFTTFSFSDFSIMRITTLLAGHATISSLASSIYNKPGEGLHKKASTFCGQTSKIFVACGPKGTPLKSSFGSLGRIRPSATTSSFPFQCSKSQSSPVSLCLLYS